MSATPNLTRDVGPEAARTAAPTLAQRLRTRLNDYALLGKLRLAALVVISAGFGFVIGQPDGRLDALGLSFVLLGGLCITAAANALNEVLERHEDARMQRTAQRPIPAGRMSVGHAAGFAFVVGAVGIALIGVFTTAMAAAAASAALLSYAFVYTPAKRWGPIAVVIGAVPGALPPLIGYLAATGTLDARALLLFLLQFVWQFPHFWAVAWRLDADYARAGYRLLPDGRSRRSAQIILLCLLAFAPLLAWAWAAALISGWALALLVAICVLFAAPAVVLYRRLDDAAALRLMFASFIALPALQLVLLLDHLI